VRIYWTPPKIGLRSCGLCGTLTRTRDGYLDEHRNREGSFCSAGGYRRAPTVRQILAARARRWRAKQ
jgi:hypothetical protein